MLYVDLEASFVRPRTLITSPLSLAGARLHYTYTLPLISIDMNDEAPYLSFNVAIVDVLQEQYPGIEPYDLNTPDVQFHIWKVMAVPDSQGRVVDLKAELVVAINEGPLGGDVTSLSLHGRQLAYSMYGGMFILDWTTTGTTPRVRQAMCNRFNVCSTSSENGVTLDSCYCFLTVGRIAS